jgi:signal transduction histidine kinase
LRSNVPLEADDGPTAAAYAHRVDKHVVRAVLATTRPADWLIVASLLLLAWFEIWVEPIFQTGMPGPRLPLTLLATVTLAPLLARRAFPLGALIVTCLGMVAVGVVGDPDQSTFVLLLGLLVAIYSLAAYATMQHAVTGAAAVVVATIVFETFTFAEKELVDSLVPVLLLAGAWVVGRQVYRHRERAIGLTEHAALLARTHSLETQAALSAERTRIARELHDVVAHAISVMGIQAGAARRTLAPEQTEQRDSLLDVERLGREALDEMQRMLGVLRTAEDDLWVGPLPDLTQLDALAADARRAGFDVSLEVIDDHHRLSTGLHLTAYRIVQEALTNVRRHAEASAVQVRVLRSGQHLEISVTDDGKGAACEPEAGNGLIGMRERVAIHNGTLYAGPGDGKGFVVRARLPVQDE